ncbi:YdcF family protein [Ottowia testudinis]|uniref:YdcF family protein n=1 Tax=Ottowia testudinis TaxID=2816950 RepID=A0A975CJY3_9BURK|nr:YdcF family protein [Ottowia testudinis]QTD47142.1 YdcF family protein [Ottowia testudinis]
MMAPVTTHRTQRLAAALIGALLAAHALWLVSRGLMHLGVMLPLAGGVLTMVLALRWPRWRAWLGARPRCQRAWQLACWGLALWLVSLALFFAHVAHTPGATATAPPHAIVVLGSGTPDCKPSPTLQARLDLAAQEARRWPQALVVTSGGADWGRTCTEGQVMADALHAAGLPASRLLVEGRSTSTDENLRFSQAVLAVHGAPAMAPVLIVTSDFHAPRAAAIARRAGYAQPQAVGAPVPLATRYNAWLREYFAYLSGWGLGEY